MAIHPLLEDRGFTGFHAKQMVEKARWAAEAFSTYGRPEVLRIAKAVAEAGYAKAQNYAQWAVEETGFGVVEHKAIKNQACSRGLYELYQDEDFTGTRLDAERKILEIARPAGVVFALTPSTNPVATVFYKIMLCLLTRNAIIISPHPMAKACCADAAKHLAQAAEDAGAPDGVIQVIKEPSLAIVETVMKSDRIDVILATGGTPVVRAAYSSGNPAIGVGPGNVPAYVDETADVAQAAKAIADSKSFDNGILCTNESAIIAHGAIAAALEQELKRNGCHVCSTEERDLLEKTLFPGAKFDIALIGKNAEIIAQQAGFRVAPRTRVLVAPLERIGDDYPLSREKLCPVIGLYVAATREAAMIACRAMTRRSGGGHSAAIHAKDASIIRRFGEEMNVLRISVNVGNSLGASGFETHLAPTMTIGTGYFGRSSVAENVGPQHLVQWVKMAWNKDERVAMPSFADVHPNEKPHIGTPPKGDIDYDFGNHPPGVASPTVARASGEGDDIRAEIRRIILEELKELTRR
ncbi:aldehyde dehydrogenase family protein [Taklimakanibacter lacteus]|uniref:aldehyde dehydrogenase family protein n=1 Tax=Taklimakanibacter lacteus TaxID=2268456 RepID=UPI000E66C8DD